MKVVVFTAQTRWPLHYETDLEIMQRHLDDGDEVYHLHCDSVLPTCDDNADHDLSRCRECIGIRRSGLALLSPKVTSAPFLRLTRENRRELAGLKKRFGSIDELRQYRLDNFDLGCAALSSVISWTRNPHADLNTHGEMISRFIISGFLVYRSMQNYLRENRTDRVYTFNGRFAPQRAALRACQSAGVTCFVHERAHDLQHYALFENTMPHDLDYIERQIVQKWVEAKDDPRRQELAEKFYLDRSKGVIQSWYSFTNNQRAGLLPPDWDPTKRNVAIFNSSEDEFEAIGDEYANPLYVNQRDALERIIETLSLSAGKIRVYLRVHPNLKGIDSAQTRHLATLKADFLKVLPPEDPVCTYTLMKQADTIVTFGSTAGIEAVYWGTPSILAGQCFYRNLGGTYNPNSHEQFIELLHADLPPKDKTAALMYGYYFNTYGIPFKYYQALGMNDGKFKGTKLVPKPTAAQILRRAFDRANRELRRVRR